jgi:hypothetical protein
MENETTLLSVIPSHLDLTRAAVQAHSFPFFFFLSTVTLAVGTHCPAHTRIVMCLMWMWVADWWGHLVELFSPT